MEAVPMSDKEWEAKNDFRTLREAWQIQNDRARFNKAITAGRKMQKEERETNTATTAVIKGGRKLGK